MGLCDNWGNLIFHMTLNGITTKKEASLNTGEDISIWDALLEMYCMYTEPDPEEE